MKHLLRFVSLVVLTVTLSFGLGGLTACTPTTTTTVKSGLDIARTVASGISAAVDAAQTFITTIVKPDAATLAKINSVIVKIKQTIAALNVALTTAKDATDVNVTALLADAQALYTTLLQLTQPLGVVTTGATAAAPDGPPTCELPPASAFKAAP